MCEHVALAAPIGRTGGVGGGAEPAPAQDGVAENSGQLSAHKHSCACYPHLQGMC